MPSGEAKLPRVLRATDGTGAPLRHAELKGRKGRQPDDGTAQTHEIMVGAIFTQHPAAGKRPWRDRDSNTDVATSRGRNVRPDDARRVPVALLRSADRRRLPWRRRRLELGTATSLLPYGPGIIDFYHAAEHVTGVVDLIEDHHAPSGCNRRRR